MPIKNLFKLKKKQDHKSAESLPSLTVSEAGKLEDSSESSFPNYPSTTTSFSSYDTSVPTINSPIYNQYITLNNDPNVSKELVPIATLLNCQASRIYHQGDVFLNVEYKDIPSTEQDLSFKLVKALVKGTQFMIYSEDSDFKPITFDLLEATFKLHSDEDSFIITNSRKLACHIKFKEVSSLQKWIAAIKLANYEFTRLNESYTASLLSARGSLLSDLHVVLAETRYQVEEWCSIKFGKNGKWVKCYSVITPFEKSRKGNKSGSLSFYTSSKTTKKNLILTISSIEHCYALFPHVELIDESSLLKIHGDVTVYNLGSNNFDIPNRSRSTSISSPVQSGNASHSRSSSISTQAINGHSRTTSISSISSAKSIKGLQIPDTSLYVLPKPHNGVKPFETLIRYLVPIYDSFQLYGRPKKLNADKTDPKSLLFGLPSLPHVEILSFEIATQLVIDQWNSITALEGLEEEEDKFNFTQLFNFKIKELYNANLKYAGFGDLKTTIYQDSAYISPLVKFTNIDLSDDSNSTPSTPKYAFSISDLPSNAPHFSSPDSTNRKSQLSTPVQQQQAGFGRYRSDSVNSTRLPSSHRSNGNLNTIVSHSRGGSNLAASIKDEVVPPVAV